MFFRNNKKFTKRDLLQNQILIIFRNFTKNNAQLE